MEEIKMVALEGVLKITKNNELLAIVHHDTRKRSQVFYACSEMGVEDIKQLLEELMK